MYVLFSAALPLQFVFESVMVRLAEPPQVRQLEHRAARGDGNSMVHFESPAAGVVGKRARSITRPNDLP